MDQNLANSSGLAAWPVPPEFVCVAVPVPSTPCLVSPVCLGMYVCMSVCTYVCTPYLDTRRRKLASVHRHCMGLLRVPYYQPSQLASFGLATSRHTHCPAQRHHASPSFRLSQASQASHEVGRDTITPSILLTRAGVPRVTLGHGRSRRHRANQTGRGVVHATVSMLVSSRSQFDKQALV
jgi:hypothetical protein